MKQLRAWIIGAAALAGIAATLALGFWQWDRARQKLALEAAIAARAAQPPLDAAALAPLAPRPEGAPPPEQAGAGSPDLDALLHRPIRLRGRWDAAHTVWLDNRQMDGRPGFYVVTPLLVDSGGAVLVQRGWAPRNFERREQLPPVQTPAGPVEVVGRLAPPPAKLYELGRAEGGAIRQNLDLARFREETRLPLPALSVQQTGAASEGLRRDWPQVGSGAGKNYGYAFQWWALSGLIAILYVWFQFVAPRRRQGRRA